MTTVSYFFVLTTAVLIISGLSDGPVVQSEVDGDGQAGGLPVELVAPEDVLESEELHVGPQGHLAHAVGVEIELVLNDLREVPVHLMAHLECLPKLPQSVVGLGTVCLEPHTLHFIQIFHGTDTFSCEFGAHVLCGVDHVGGEHVGGALAVDVTVCGVESLRLRDGVHGPQEVPGVPQDGALHDVQLYEGGGVVQRPLQQGQGLLGVLEVTVVLRKVHQHKQNTRGLLFAPFFCKVIR